MATLQLAGECPDVRTLVADCVLASDNSTVSFCLAGGSDDSGDGEESSEADATCSDAQEIELTALTATGIEAVDFTALSNTTSIGELNVSFNAIEFAEDVEVPAGLTSLYLDNNLIEEFEFQAQWGTLRILSVSNNPISSFSAPTKVGPIALIAQNVSLTNFTSSSFPSKTQVVDLSHTGMSEFMGFKPPMDLHELILQNSSVQTVKSIDFSNCRRPFTIDLANNSVSTIQGVVFPVNLRKLLLNGSDITYFEIRESDESVIQGLEVFEVSSFSLNRHCVSKASERSVTILNTSYSICVLPDSVFFTKYGFGGSPAELGSNMMTPFLLLFSMAGFVFVLLMLLICKRKRYEQQREAEKTTRRRGNTIIDAARSLQSLPHSSSMGPDSTRGETNSSRSVSIDGEWETLSQRGYVIANDVRKDPDFENLRIALTEIQRDKVIAKGGGGIVYLAVLRSSSERVVLKQMYPEKAKNPRVVEKFMEEIRLYSKLKHDKIVAFRGISWSTLQDLSMVLEYMPNGDLSEMLERQQRMDPGRDGWCWSSREEAGFGRSKLAFALDISDAVLYLHSFSDPVIHRDLKAQNVLLSKTWIAKLSDFGASRVKSGSETAMQLTAEVGTVAWIAPEVIRGDKYDQQVDIYSFGVVLCELDTCAKPYAIGVTTCDGDPVPEDNEDEEGDNLTSSRRGSRGGIFSSNAILAMAVSENRVRPAFHRDCPRTIRDLGLQCMHGNPRERPTAKELYAALRTIEEKDMKPAHV